MSAPGDQAKVTIFVAVQPQLAFEVFTQEIDLWWRRGPKFRHSGRRPGVLKFEPGPGGRLFESWDGGLVEVGRITAWEPPARLVFEWRNATFAPNERTEVEVRFVAAPGGTEVSVEHRGWSALGPDHPARHGQVGIAFSAMIGTWWSEVLMPFRERLSPGGEGG